VSRLGFETFDSLSFDPDLGSGLGHDPVAMVKSTERSSLNSRRFITRFQAADTAPVQVVDATTQAQRDAQIVQITRRICALDPAVTDAQALALYGTFLKGWM
jgi:hypothetical protein